MNRMLPALCLALLTHLWLFSVEISILTPYQLQSQPYRRTVTMSLFARAPVEPVAPQVAAKIEPKPKPVSPPGPPKPVRPPPPKPAEQVSPIPAPAQTKQHHQPTASPLEPSSESTATAEPDHTETAAPLDDVGLVMAIREASPMYHVNPPPPYPAMAKRRGYHGTVIVEALVTVDGSVSELRIAQSSGYPILDRAARQSVANWAFTPGKRGDQIIEMWVRVPVRFELH